MRLLLHVCCAPCTPHVFRLLSGRFEVRAFFYNPNIQPESEYRFRRQELEKAAAKEGWPIEFAEYDPENWRRAVSGLEAEPERGRRCAACFRFRLGRAFAEARAGGYGAVATTLAVSPHKRIDQIHAAGQEWEARSGIAFLAENFRKQDGFQESRRLARELEIVHQHYCGCEFSLAESELRRRRDRLK